jgi:hypothetical protein
VAARHKQVMKRLEAEKDSQVAQVTTPAACLMLHGQVDGGYTDVCNHCMRVLCVQKYEECVVSV